MIFLTILWAGLPYALAIILFAFLVVWGVVQFTRLWDKYPWFGYVVGGVFVVLCLSFLIGMARVG